jgi:radical SAM protein with 4Fe4S-binding SPASM domain
MELIFPEAINVETINRCNLKCVMCPRDRMTRPQGTMDIELYRKIVADCRNYVEHIANFDLFMDGEPLLDKLLEERIRIAKAAGIKVVNFATNGTLLTQPRAKSLIGSGLDRIVIDVDGMDKDSYEKIRRGSNYDGVIANVENLIAVKHEIGSARPEITVRMVGLEETKLQRGAFLRYWKGKVDHAVILPGHNWGGTIPVGEKVNHRNAPCSYLWRQMIIHMDGTVVLCCMDYEGVHKLGNVCYESIYDIWHGEKFGQYRQRFENSEIDLCNHCNWIPSSVIADVIPERDWVMNELELVIQQMQHSIPMQLANRYQGVVERLLPTGTRRRRYYEFGLGNIRNIFFSSRKG